MKTLTRAQYLMALGLFTLAQHKQAQVREFEAELNALLEIDPEDLGGHVSDAVYSPNDTLDAALARQGIAVEPAEQIASRL